MRKVFFTLLFLGMTSSPLFAILSPINQSIKEIDAIVRSNEITQNFNQADTIQEIRKTDGGYVVTSEDKRMVVDVVYTPSQTPGPQQFKLVFHPATPINY